MKTHHDRPRPTTIQLDTSAQTLRLSSPTVSTAPDCEIYFFTYMYVNVCMYYTFYFKINFYQLSYFDFEVAHLTYKPKRDSNIDFHN